MKILHIITNTELGGAQKVCIELCTCAVADGNTVAVASMKSGYLWQALPKPVVQYQLKTMVKAIKPIKDLHCIFELKTVIKKFNPDIIHLHSSKAGVLGRLAAWKISPHIVYTVHGFDSIRLRHRFFLPLERILQNRCGSIVGVSEYDTKHLRAEKIKQNVSLVYNGVAENFENKILPILQKYANKKIVMTIARIAPPKNFQMFLNVAQKLDVGKYQLVWIGGSVEYSVEEIKKKYTIPTNVTLLGDIPNASAQINCCNIFVLFSHYEGLPMTIIEAMSQRKPIVASNVGGIPELVDTSNGYLVTTEEEAIAAINTLSNNEDLRVKMEETSYEKYCSNFTLQMMWQKYKNIYLQLLKK